MMLKKAYAKLIGFWVRMSCKELVLFFLQILHIFPKLYKITWSSHIKFSFYEKATKICAIFVIGFDVNSVNVKNMRKIAQIFEVFSEKLNFKDLVKTQGDEKRKILL